MDGKEEDPLHRLSRTPTKASQQQQWEVWKEAERQRVQPIKEWGKSPNRINKAAHHTPPRTSSKSIPSSSSPRNKTAGFATPPRTTTAASRTTTSKSTTPQKKTTRSSPKHPEKVEESKSKHALTGATKMNKKQSIESSVPSAAASGSATSTAPPSEPTVKAAISEVKPASPRKKSVVETNQATENKEPIESTPSSEPITSTTSTRSSIPDAVMLIEIPDKTVAMKLFDQLDENASGKLSLAELDKGIVTLFPDMNNKPAIMAAYKAADRSNNGFVERTEFGYFLRYIVYYNNLWSLFSGVDTDGDRRMTRDEFMAAAASDKLQLTREAQDVFAEIDTNSGGMILFDEFIHWMATTNNTWSPKDMHDETNNAKVTAAATSAPETQIAQVVQQIVIPGKEKARKLFDELDENASGKLSLAELDKGIVTLFPHMNNKPAIMAAYKAADRSNNGFVERKEFGYFLRYIVYYNNLWSLFSFLDDDGDRRITLDEFTEATDLLALPRDAHDIFHEIDTNGGGMILFQEFVDWMATNEQKFESSDKNDIHDIEKQLDALASS